VSRGARAQRLHDEYGERLQSCDLQLRQYGSIRAFFGAMTQSSADDNVLLNSVLTDEVDRSVLVVDGGGSVPAR
jgi:regulator of ribonuclease activity A